jgi:RNA polymerase sigma factor (sigma-70 family)
VARSVLRTQSDSRLTELARAGSEPAFEAIVARYRRSLVRYCARVVGEGDAEEAVQEALLKAHAALAAGDPVRRLAPWLHVVAHNTALSYLRARSSRPQASDSDYELCATVDSSTEYRQELGEVLDAVRSLPVRQRDAIIMRELEGRSYDEIAAHLGSSHGAVRQLLHRARSSLRERVAALLPLEPFARWALTGPGGADAAGGAGLSGACVLGAKACAALLVPATVALVASGPASRPKTSRAKAATPAVAAAAATTYRHHAAVVAAARLPAATTRVARTSSATRPVSVSASNDTRALTADPRGGATTTTATSSQGENATDPSSSPAAPTKPVPGSEHTPSIPTPVPATPSPQVNRAAMGEASSPPSAGPQGAWPMHAAVATPVR